tara:strand:+ start:1294 stop:2244 length:951 start_codon:yes stop_codon:yes gene_type:complete
MFKIRLALLTATFAAGLSACSPNTKGSPRDPLTLETSIEAGQATNASQRGLELRVMTVDDSENRVARSLARYEQSTGSMSNEDIQRWRSWGLRLIVVPIDKLDSILGSQDLTQAAQVRWMGEFPQWRPIIRTGEIHSNTVRVQDSDGARYQTLVGRPRLLARVWTVPEVTDDGLKARLHMDLAIQMTQPQRSNRWGEIRLPTALDEGDLINELMISPVFDSSSALILVGEDPLVSWGFTDEDESFDASSEERTSIGPRTPQARTLGQQMLSTPGTGYVAPGVRYVPPKKVLIVLVPKADGQYRLLGPTTTRKDQGS